MSGSGAGAGSGCGAGVGACSCVAVRSSAYGGSVSKPANGIPQAPRLKTAAHRIELFKRCFISLILYIVSLNGSTVAG